MGLFRNLFGSSEPAHPEPMHSLDRAHRYLKEACNALDHPKKIAPFIVGYGTIIRTLQTSEEGMNPNEQNSALVVQQYADLTKHNPERNLSCLHELAESLEEGERTAAHFIMSHLIALYPLHAIPRTEGVGLAEMVEKQIALLAGVPVIFETMKARMGGQT